MFWIVIIDFVELIWLEWNDYDEFWIWNDDFDWYVGFCIVDVYLWVEYDCRFECYVWYVICSCFGCYFWFDLRVEFCGVWVGI